MKYTVEIPDVDAEIAEMYFKGMGLYLDEETSAGTVSAVTTKAAASGAADQVDVTLTVSASGLRLSSESRGSYTLSYSHLETPGSPQANAWLAHLLRSLAGLSPHTDATPSWDVAAQPVLWPDAPATATTAMMAASAKVRIFFFVMIRSVLSIMMIRFYGKSGSRVRSFPMRSGHRRSLPSARHTP